MNDRGIKKWNPFNSVVPSSELFKNNKPLKMPNPSESEITYFEELLKESLYTGQRIWIKYINRNKIFEEEKIVKKIDSVNLNIFFLDNTKINFRQIYKIKPC